jgi:threonine dehydrogenase-like Zn-dependent dehydrogenase
MLAAVIRSGRLVLVHKPQPRLPRGWALMRVRLAGICNTDVEILRGYFDFRGTPGHEFVGQVERVADRSDVGWVGQRVVGEINISCTGLGLRPLCAFCRSGLPRHCARRRVLGIVGQDGAFAEYLSMPVANLHRVPGRIPDEAAVFTEPLAAACEILEQVDVTAYPQAAVLGDGKLAQLIARALQAAGVRVLLIGKYASKLRLAQGAGIRAVQVRRRAARRADAFPLVVEATGSPSGLSLAQQITAPRGTLVLKSTFHGAAPVQTWPLVVKEITAVGSRCGSFSRALELLRGRRLDLQPLISRVFPLSDIPAAMRYAQRPGVMKALVRIS